MRSTLYIMYLFGTSNRMNSLTQSASWRAHLFILSREFIYACKTAERNTEEQVLRD